MQPDAAPPGHVTRPRQGRRALRPPLWLLFLLLGCLLIAVVVVTPGWVGELLWEVIPVVAAVAMAAGIRRHRPPAASAWWLMTAGVAVWAASDLLWTGWYVAAGDAGAVPRWVDLLYVPMYPLVALGLSRLQRDPDRAGNGGVTLDAVVIVMGIAFLYWTLIFNPYLGAESLGDADHLTALLYLGLDMAVVFMGARLWFRYGNQSTSYALLGLAFTALLVADAVYTTTLVDDGGPGVSILDGSGAELVGSAAWLLWLVLMGTAALHPSMTGARDVLPSNALTVARGGVFLSIACAGPVFFLISLGPGPVTLTRADLAVPLALLTGLSAFLIIRLVVGTSAAQRRALLLDEQAAELSRAAEEQSALQELVSHRAMHDPLTGLANRALFNDRLEQATVRRSPAARHALLLLDLDGFKHVNDGYGHPVGDQLLIQAARRLREIVREADTLARFGGDEFAVLLEDVTAEEAGEIAGRVVEAVAEAFTVGGYALHVTTSVGLYMIAESADAQEALRDADLALYAAKAAGKNQISVFHPGLRVERLDQARIAEGLRRALEEDEFVLNYQPVVDLRTGAVHAVEALLRWHSPEGVVPPDAFIPTAEETGLIVPIGVQVLRRACFDARRWHERYGIAVNVNVSGHQLHRPGFVATVLDALADSGLPGEALILEITETALLATGQQETARVIEYLSELRTYGVRVAIDDFGTGYSSLAYLQHLPVDVVKIDGAFTGYEAGTDTASRQRHALTRAIIGLCESLDLPAVAEKVETVEQEEFLRDMRCPLGQGYLFSRPLPAQDLDRLLAGGAARDGSGRVRGLLAG
ncbi:bifunctional diguanylate cyclase/phosphodiesterase [Planomonospora sp. ID82291]|uniref:putative bifunctional diguanylate cyclase/phosphodiesterase n=1 Tax=Planomonospora sp. ID82291 TaxID=2738136 RepID=UPI0018C39DF3|nr:EAL domain-containing protein [Planomonospora sp. ID82291]MBG0818621.1 EAL domain-containing protein [Planomonospora sp. ID82291]